MISNKANLLASVHEYVDQYIAHLDTNSVEHLDAANRDLRRVISELERLNEHVDQPEKIDRLNAYISAQVDTLRATAQKPAPRTLSHPKQTLAQAFRDYINTEIAYLTKASGGVQRQQVNLLLSDVIADLKALALHPDDEQAFMLAKDLAAKEEQLHKLQRPWQNITTETN